MDRAAQLVQVAGDGLRLDHQLLGDPKDGGVEMSEHRLRNKMEECLAVAKERALQE